MHDQREHPADHSTAHGAPEGRPTEQARQARLRTGIAACVGVLALAACGGPTTATTPSTTPAGGASSAPTIPVGDVSASDTADGATSSAVPSASGGATTDAAGTRATATATVTQTTTRTTGSTRTAATTASTGTTTAGTPSTGTTSTGTPTTTSTLSPSAAATTTGSSATACRGSQLSVGSRDWYGATGHTSMTLVFRNVSATACTLRGYPGVDMTYNGATVHAARTLQGFMGGAGSVTTVTLAPGGRATAMVEAHMDPDGSGTCSSSATVTPPNTSTSSRVPMTGMYCYAVQVHPVAAG